METFGERLRLLRIEQNISQEMLAQKLNISKSTVSMYERNERQPSFTTVINLARLFGVSTDYLLGMKPYDRGGNGVLTEASLSSEEVEYLREQLNLYRTHIRKRQR
ncbi:helix-turn-helix domain-containing protein [Alteribacter natronophilus]|uniref:helix-turn-helix domain-containing protein n=1 Tax=Alteribacter natronophilus TaxID=2583810 RepID=UPI00148649ED|nr:helix-turn-helix transcriptional regulator [Alteribacter natronophilus]